MSTTQDVIKGRLRSLEESLESAEADRARLMLSIRHARTKLRYDSNIQGALKTLDNALKFVDRRRRVE